MKMLLVTGLSGAGKSTALKAMEDTGYETVDNVPLSLLPLLLSPSADADRMVVVGVDVRSRDFTPEHFGEALEALRNQPDHGLEILFLDCDDEALQRRFTETRRKHPLAQDRPVKAGIEQERRLLADIREKSDVVVNTSGYLAADLRARVQRLFAQRKSQLSIFVESFSYKKGIPREADMVFDVRFLQNPHYVEGLRAKTGEQAEVGAYIEEDEAFAEFFKNLLALLTPLLPRYKKEGKSYLTLAIGCTGGQHRSVYVSEKLSATLAESGYEISVSHREL